MGDDARRSGPAAVRLSIRSRWRHYLAVALFAVAAWTLSQVIIADVRWPAAVRGGLVVAALWVAGEIAFDALVGRRRRRPTDGNAPPNDDTLDPGGDRPRSSGGP